jgi:hypothetical protein
MRYEVTYSNTNAGTVSFGDIRKGQFFRYCGATYWKIESPLDDLFKAVCLRTAKIAYFKDTERVFAITGEFSATIRQSDD